MYVVHLKRDLVCLLNYFYNFILFWNFYASVFFVPPPPPWNLPYSFEFRRSSESLRRFYKSRNSYLEGLLKFQKKITVQGLIFRRASEFTKKNYKSRNSYLEGLLNFQKFLQVREFIFRRDSEFPKKQYKSRNSYLEGILKCVCEERLDL